MRDIDYKKALLQELGQNPEEYGRLSAIVGKEEFLDFLRVHQDMPQTYSQREGFRNVRDKSFRANFHIHTTNSDGLMTVERLLELGAQYGDAVAQKFPGEKFYLAVTDHNTTQGTIEALQLVFNNPDKYKNLKVVLGVEASAIFPSANAGTASEVHLLSYCLNPFTDTIALVNRKRLQVFQYQVKNALNNANVRYIDTINRYGFEFGFDDMAKIRPSIKTCPSNVRYSMKDYLQFRLLYAALIENNSEIVRYLKRNGMSLAQLNFAVPKTMIMESKYSPYWRNYVEKLQVYMEKEILKNNKNADLGEFRRFYGYVSPEVEENLNSFEGAALDPRSDMYIREPAPLTFGEVVNSFRRSETAVSGIAHGALYEQNNPKQSLFLQDLYREFKVSMGTDELIGEQHYPYKESINPRLVQGLIKLYGYIPSGGLDSHKNNFFTPQTSFEKDFLDDLIGKKEDVLGFYRQSGYERR